MKKISGELNVGGKDHVLIPLLGRPKVLHVRFKKEFHVHTCNPRHHDELNWEVVEEIRQHHGHLVKKYLILIKWNVSSNREIIWEIGY